jgi:hypothetical protein
MRTINLAANAYLWKNNPGVAIIWTIISIGLLCVLCPLWLLMKLGDTGRDVSRKQRNKPHSGPEANRPLDYL